jgi:hypothetical protein
MMVVKVGLLLVLIKPSKGGLAIHVNNLDETTVVACHKQFAIVAKTA